MDSVPVDTPDPEQNAARLQRAEMMRAVLSSLLPREREVLTRFYLDEQPQRQICRDMRLTDTQFRLLKSRAKAHFDRRTDIFLIISNPSQKSNQWHLL